MLILNGIIHTMDGEAVDSGFVQLQGERIQAVGHMSQLPAGAEQDQILDARGGHVLPGLLDIHCHVGLYGAGVGAEGDDLNETSDPCTPHLRALDGVNPLDDYFREARQAGVTCLLTGPGSTNPIGGQSVLLKTAGRVADRMVVRAPAAMKFALGENPKRAYGKRGDRPMTRMATAALIRESLTRALDYHLRWERAQASQEEDGPEFDAKLDALRPVMAGKLAAHFHAHRADDMVTAIRLAREFGLECVLVHGTEGHLIADYLAKEGVPVITGPILTDRSKPELANLTMENTAILARAGVQVAICTDHPETPIQHLLLCAALAAKAGMDEEEALAAVTINAACIAGVGDRLGSLTPGKDGDVVVMDGHPLDWRSQVTHVLIDGREVERI
ncbi:MAG TPA: amidohydrolase [Firmicutes bacterium]|nr:amidohydrolase [Bacillota bacterium]